MVSLFVQPACREFLLVLCAHQDTSFAVLRLGAAVNPNPASSGHLAEYRQQAFEPRTLRHLHGVDKCRNEVVGVLQRLTDRCQVFLVDACTAAETVGYLV